MRWLRAWWRSLARRYPGKPNGRALDPAFQRAARRAAQPGGALLSDLAKMDAAERNAVLGTIVDAAMKPSTPEQAELRRRMFQ
jgi:hypothetical protein